MLKKLSHTHVTLLGILLFQSIALCPAAFAQQILIHSQLPVVQSEGEQRGVSAVSLDSLLEEAYMLEKKGDFKSAISVYGSAINLAASKKDYKLENYLRRKKGTMFLFTSQLDSATLYFLEVNKIAKKNQVDSTLAKVLVNQGYLADKRGNNQDCILYYDSAMVIFEKIKDTLGIVSVLNNKALLYEDRGDYAMALEFALESESLLSSGQNKFRHVAGLITLGNVYEKLKNYDSALAIYERTYKLSNELGFKGYANTSLSNIAVCYFRQEKFTESEIALKKAINYSIEIDDKAGLARLYSNIGIIYRHQDKNELAFQSYLKALQIAEELNDSLRMISIFNNLGVINKKEKKYEQAINYYQKSLSIAQKINSKNAIRKAYGNLASLYGEKGDYKNAFTNLTLASAWQDSVLNEEKVRAIEDMQAKYESEKKLAQIKALQDENRIKELEKKSIRTERNTTMGISVTAVFLLLVILYYFRMKARKNRIIDAQRIQQLEDEKKLLSAQSIIVGQEKERKRIAQELHDGIGVLLSTASIHFSVVSKTAQNKKTIEMLNKAEMLLKQAGGEVRKISQNMMPVVLSKFGLLEALEDMFEKLDELEDIEVNANFSGSEQRLPENMEIMLYRVIQEMVNNTLKHAQAKTIEFSCKKSDETIVIDYKDDGKGFDLEKLPHNKSLGVFGIKSRVDFLKGKLQVNTAVGKGTHYQITIPVPA
ncbi:MAG TPA: sensor histidine kinase [Bacteroidales bacterium]